MRSSMSVQQLRIIGYSAANAYADLRAIYTWKTWTVCWLGRMLAQVPSALAESRHALTRWE